MSWTNECSESNFFKVKNTEEVRKVLEHLSFEVHENEGKIFLYGGSEEDSAYLDEDAEVVIAKEP